MDAAENKPLVRSATAQPTEALTQAHQHMEAQIELLRSQAEELKEAIKKTTDDQKEASIVVLESKIDTIMAKVDRETQQPSDDIQTMAVKLVQAIKSNSASKVDERLAAIEAKLSEINGRLADLANSSNTPAKNNSTRGSVSSSRPPAQLTALPAAPATSITDHSGPGNKRRRVEDDGDAVHQPPLSGPSDERRRMDEAFRHLCSLNNSVFERLELHHHGRIWNHFVILKSLFSIFAENPRAPVMLAKFMDQDDAQNWAWHCVRSIGYSRPIWVDGDGKGGDCKGLKECLQIARNGSGKYRLRMIQ